MPQPLPLPQRRARPVGTTTTTITTTTISTIISTINIPAAAVPPAQSQQEQGTPGTGPLAPQATGSSAASPVDPVKYARGPAVLQRPHGPSLLTQALATARGIPRQNQPSSHPPQQPSPPEPPESLFRDVGDRDPRHGSLTPADGDQLTPRFSSPRKTTTMPSAAPTSTAVAAAGYGRFDLAEVNSILNGHREFLSRTKGRTSSFDSTERDLPSRRSAHFHDKAATNPPASPRLPDLGVALHDGPAEVAGVADARPQPRAWKTDQRISMGPEKAWSIGSGDAGSGEDGQVEKSISEVPFPRDKLAEIHEHPAGGDAVEEPRVPEDGPVSAERQNGARVLPARTPKAKTVHGSPEDHFALKQGEYVREVVSEPATSVDGQDEEQPSGVEPPELGHELKPRRVSDLDAEAGESGEEGEESGEEKISSAVFLPHQAPEQEQSHAPMPGAPQRAAPSRRHSRHDDFHPWLVKADEPETDRTRESLDLDNEMGLEAPGYPTVAPEVASRQVDEPAPVDECEPAVPPSRSSRPVSLYHEDAVHEHQLSTPRQPLEAIELIPYKHQFYEKIEKYHRDLLAFLPRYIGVLNVTFQKQPRRKSTMRRDTAVHETSHVKSNGAAQEKSPEPHASDAPRVVSQSIHPSSAQVPTVTFVDNQHILPRNLLQPAGSLPSYAGRFRSSSAYAQAPPNGALDGRAADSAGDASRPSLQERHANSWGATTVNKKLRNEVFNDAFLKQPIAIHRHRKGHQRVARRPLQHVLRPSGSDPSLIESHEKSASEPPAGLNGGVAYAHSQSDLSPSREYGQDDETAPKDMTGTSAPEPEILADSSPAQRKKRRYSGSGLRRKPKDVRDGRGDLKYYEEADDAGYKGDREDPKPTGAQRGASTRPDSSRKAERPGGQHPAVAPPEFGGKIPRPVNPKEAQTQRDSRVEYFLLLEDLTAGMKRPCIMDLKMGTRQYGVDANPKKQKSQQGKCAETTSRELGVRVCGLQVWDVKTQSYEFRDKYYGRELKPGAEFQAALTRFLYDGVDRGSILRHIPTVLHKLDELEVIIKRLRGYRFYAASLLMFYDGDDDSAGDTNGNHNSNSNSNYYVEDSTTDFATDTEEVSAAPRRGPRRSRREIDFKMADFANCVTAGDLSARDRPCPPRHPNDPDRGFLRGLRSLRRYFLKIQRDTRAEMGLVGPLRNGGGVDDVVVEEDEDEEGEGSVSE
ncbi:ae7d61e7-e4e5-4ade-9229-47d81b6f2260 [Thermothielavioides terrestris]|uniref:Kinase n=1 Tax=Thermothielavioides terrestris TaxID=2587410 RepID=A0A3S4B3B2_9PEZI|nr:ae7d61e7-e4e5-4ade-9229-47d81b6f2260 [Thermothielavioides terrestris]